MASQEEKDMNDNIENNLNNIDKNNLIEIADILKATLDSDEHAGIAPTATHVSAAWALQRLRALVR